ncbi:MAG TPA: alanyl-tRNA editing protein, partial [Spirochaetia bacterium]|nr:alanyl-tRNA editing protein [Spirochaetia bacterium]
EGDESGHEGDEIVHVLESAVPAGPVRCVVDAARRLDYMTQHTGQHILSQALVRAGDLPTVSVHFGEQTTTIELAVPEVRAEVLDAAEELANGAIRRNLGVRVHEIDRSELSKYPLRRTPPKAQRLRIVEVDGFDWAACGGVHVRNAGELLLIKVVGQERIRGRVRIHAVIGARALADYRRKTALVQALSRALTCGEENMLSRVEELSARGKEMAQEIRRLTTRLAAADADQAASSARAVGGAAIVRRGLQGAGADYLKLFAEGVIARPGRVVIVTDRTAEAFQWLVAQSVGDRLDLGGLLPPLYAIGGCKGGGKGARVQGRGTRPDAAEAFAQAVEEEIARRLS